MLIFVFLHFFIFWLLVYICVYPSLFNTIAFFIPINLVIFYLDCMI